MSYLWGEIPKEEEDSVKGTSAKEGPSKSKGAEAVGGPIFQPSSRHYPPSSE
jgi:hypothetical protein